ncbi:altered inheritance rate of mitochondria protein 25 [Cucumis melo var. makuwa]|uniref:Altered inheritance rate of mitochondria protein 25 n=1 Tax=Cucumis melo var. makuwa TaxID=1194695 RepID=A0A5A7TVA3_CUCMM|nr:altered inheritance rate of mitochondria protein 25 [Cucumis melo var. makuwa]
MIRNPLRLLLHPASIRHQVRLRRPATVRLLPRFEFGARSTFAQAVDISAIHYLMVALMEVRVAPLLARSNLLITRDIEWANLVFGLEQDPTLLEFAWLELLEQNKAVTTEELAEVMRSLVF